MRTQIAKSAHLPAEYILPTFLTRGTLPLFRRLTVGAAIEKKFFLFFQSRLTRFKFLDISHEFRFFGLSNINYRFNSLQVFSRYSSRLYSLDIISIAIPDFASDFRLVIFYFLDLF